MKWAIECGVALPDKFIRNIFCETHKVNAFRFKYGNTGVYTSAYEYEDSESLQSCNIIGDLYFDLDADLDASDGFARVRDDALGVVRYAERILSVPSGLINIFFSGCKGIHITIPRAVFCIDPCADLNHVFKYIASDVVKYAATNGTLDTRIYDRRRLFRMPHSRHNKSGLYKIPLAREELVSMQIEDIRTIATSPRAIHRDIPSMRAKAKSAFEAMASVYRSSVAYREIDISLAPLTTTPPCIQYILDNTVQRGQRNNTAIALCSFFKQAGKSHDEAISRLRSWNADHCSPPLSESELMSIAKSAYNKEYRFGCSTLREISVCTQEKCELCGRNCNDIVE